MKKYYLGIIIVLAAATLLFGFEKKRDLNINANGLQKMEVDAGAGNLKIVGVKGLHQIKVTATIRADRISDKKAEKFIRENVELKLERHGSSATTEPGSERWLRLPGNSGYRRLSGPHRWLRQHQSGAN